MTQERNETQGDVHLSPLGVEMLEQIKQEQIKKWKAEAPSLIKSILAEAEFDDWAVDGLTVIFDLLANRLPHNEAADFALDLRDAAVSCGRSFDQMVEGHVTELLESYNAKESYENQHKDQLEN